MATAATIDVPAGQPTIQAAVAAASDGDTILVAPGTYDGGVDFGGKSLTLESSAGASRTTIRGGNPVVRMTGPATVALRGFTITGGDGSQGGGVYVANATGVVERNVIVDNLACGEGGGVNVQFATVTILRNVVAGNGQNGCSGGTGGGGIRIGGDAGTSVVRENLIVDNSWGSAGGGLSVFAAAPEITGNIVAANSADNSGGGAWVVNVPMNAAPVFSNNLFVGNDAADGGGLDMLVPQTNATTRLTNNTFVDNDATGSGRQMRLQTFGGSPMDLSNNAFVGDGAALIECSGTMFPTGNDLFRRDGGATISGTCLAPPADGNIAANPLFVNESAGDFHLAAASPLIDAGTTPAASALDFDGDPRPLDGNDAGTTASFDIGFDEAEEQGNALQTTLTSSPADFAASTEVATFAFTAAAPGATFECNLDMQGFVPCASPVSYTNLRGHLHAFQVRARIGASVDRTPAMRMWRVDACTVVGTDGPDTLTGTSGPDVICALGGDDKVQGLGGGDIVYGGAGADTIDGGTGADDVYGQAGADTIEARDGTVDGVDCGSESDLARLDATDTRVDCESVNPAPVAPPVTQPPAPAPTVAPPPPPPGPGSASVFSVTVAPKVGVSALVGCTRPRGTCMMRVTLTATRRVRRPNGRISPLRTVAVGTATVTIADGATQTIAVRLNPTGRTLLRARRSLKANAVLAIGEEKGFRTLATRAVTIR